MQVWTDLDWESCGDGYVRHVTIDTCVSRLQIYIISNFTDWRFGPGASQGSSTVKLRKQQMWSTLQRWSGNMGLHSSVLWTASLASRMSHLQCWGIGSCRLWWDAWGLHRGYKNNCLPSSLDKEINNAEMYSSGFIYLGRFAAHERDFHKTISALVNN